MADYVHDPLDLTPLMTSDTTPSPNVTSASGTVGGYNAYKAFVHSVSTAGSSAWIVETTSGWISFDFGSTNEKTIVKYTVSAYDYFQTGRNPKDWTFQGSNNGSTWTTLDTVANETGWAQKEMRTFEFTNSTAYRYYRLNISSNNGDGSYLSIGEIELFEKTPTTWNPSDKHSDITLTEGNLKATDVFGANDWNNVRCILGRATGKWYWEVIISGTVSPNDFGVGIASSLVSLSGEIFVHSEGYEYIGYNGHKGNSNSHSAYGDIFGDGDIIAVALDLDAGKIWWAKNGVWQGGGDPAAGSGEAFSGVSGTFYPIASIYKSDSQKANFGDTVFQYIAPNGFDSYSGADEIIWARANLNNIHMSAEGFTGIDARDVTIPHASAESFTGIDARDVTNPHMSVESFTGITARPSIAMPTALVTGHDDIEHSTITAVIPFASANIKQAAQIWGNATTPSMTAAITERETLLGNVTIPMMSVEVSSGAHADIEAAVPMMAVDGQTGQQCGVTVPMMTVEMEGVVGRVINSSARIPAMTAEAAGMTGHLADSDVAIPMARVAAELMTGKLLSGAATVPMIVAELTSYEDINGDIDVSIPAMLSYLEGTTERAACPVLRYTEPEL